MMRIFRRKEAPKSSTLPVMRDITARIEELAPERLRDQLFAAATAAERGDDQKLLALCHRHGREIFGEAAVWSHVPEAFRGSRRLTDWYREGLRIIAGFYSEQLRQREIVTAEPVKISD
jgi:hypothetical protein